MKTQILGIKFSVILPLFALLTLAPSARAAETAKQIISSEEHMRELMVEMSKQLGVTCTACHNTENFKSDRKDTFKIAKEHMKLTQLLIDNGLDGKKERKADCYMCHRGQLSPKK